MNDSAVDLASDEHVSKKPRIAAPENNQNPAASSASTLQHESAEAVRDGSANKLASAKSSPRRSLRNFGQQTFAVTVDEQALPSVEDTVVEDEAKLVDLTQDAEEEEDGEEDGEEDEEEDGKNDPESALKLWKDRNAARNYIRSRPKIEKKMPSLAYVSSSLYST